MPIAGASTTLDMGAGVTGSEGGAVVCLTGGAACSRQFAILSTILLVTNLVSAAQLLPRGASPLGRQPVALSHKSKSHRSKPHVSPPPPYTHLKPPPLKGPYEPMTSRELLRWFTADTIDPSILVGDAMEAALGTAPNRPNGYGPHWGGFGRRYGIGLSGDATGSAIQGVASLILREDPRYFRIPDQPFKARIRNVLWLSVAARNGKDSFKPSYARYTAVLGGSFLSNSWRVNGEANAHDALLRSAEDYGGVLAANAFEEFWPDVKRRVFHKRNWRPHE